VKPRSNSERPLPLMPLENLSRGADSRKKVSPDDSDRISAEIFDAALTAADIESTWVAAHLGVSESLVSRWRSPNYTEAPSFTQMLRLPVSFHWELNRATSKRFGFGRRAIAQVLEGLGMLAMEQG
jgi:hypothetical protein